MKNIDIITEDKVISSYKECRTIETILLYIYATFAIIASLCCLLQNETASIIGILLFGTFGYIAVIVEHKRQIVFNKENDSLYITEKALGVKKYKIENKVNISDIARAEVYKRVIKRPSNRTSMTYGVKLLLKDGKEVYPYGGITSSFYDYWEKQCCKINNYLTYDQTILVLNERSFIFRIVGCLLSSLYFYMCYICIFSLIQ